MEVDFTDRIGDRLDHPENVPPQYKHLIADDIQRVERILSFPVSGRVLDVGCSDGAITRRIRERWALMWPVGSDVEHPLRTQDGCSYIDWDIRYPYPFEPRAFAFDAIYCCEVLEHLTGVDADQALENMLAVLKPGGDLIVTVPNRHPNDLYEVGCRSRWAWPDHRSRWLPSKLRMWLSPYFQEIECVPLYDGEAWEESIWLIARGVGKK